MYILKKINNKSHKGQATIEYILLLIFGVVIVLGFSAQISEPFKNFIDGLFSSDNGYYSCLFETASLPGNTSNCNFNQFQPGSASWGLNLSGSSPSISSSTTPPTSSSPSLSTSTLSPGPNYTPIPSSQTNSSFSSSSSSFSPSAQDWGNPNSGFTGNRTGGSSSGGSQSFLANNNSNSNRFSRQGNSSAVSNSDRFISDRNKSKNKKKNKKKRATLTPVRGSFGSDSSGRGNRGFISQGGLSQAQKNQQSRQVPFSTGSIKKSSNTRDPQKTTFVMNDPPKKTKEMEDGEPLTFGKFIKYIMLGILLLVILFFIGNKAMEVSENLKAA